MSPPSFKKTGPYLFALGVFPLFGEKIDYSLYVITDCRLCRGRSQEDVVEKAVRGGSTCIQLREKEVSVRKLYNMALALLEITRQRGAALIVNDRLDVALAAGADGVHLGQDDLPLPAARRIMPEGMVLGVSVDNVQQAQEAEAAGASYLGAGSVFATSTKPDAGSPIGVEAFAAICRSVRIPVVGIGGINAGNAGEVIKAGGAGVAVISAVVGAEDIKKAAQELSSEVSRARRLAKGEV